jgi:hypothetical protein
MAGKGNVKILGNILLDIISASGLTPVDGKSADPFVKIKPLDGLVLAGNQDAYFTTAIQKNVNPQWNASLEVPIGSSTGSLQFRVMDHNDFTPDALIGLVSLSVASVISGEFKVQRELPLLSEKGAKAGTLLIRAAWSPAQSSDVPPLEEIAAYEPGSYQFKTFSSAAARSIRDDINAANRQCRDWLNTVRHCIDLVKLDNDADAQTAYVTVWYKKK